MTEIRLITPEDPLWEETAAFAGACSWEAGPKLAELMRRREFKDWERVCVGLVDGKLAGYCTFTEKDEMPAEQPFSPFVGFVFTEVPYRGRRLYGSMIEAVSEYARELGYGRLYVMSGWTGLYEKYGFVKVGDYETIYGWKDQLFVKPL